MKCCTKAKFPPSSQISIEIQISILNHVTNQTIFSNYKSSLGAQLLPGHTLFYIKVFKLRIFKPGKKISMVLPSSPVKISGKL